MQDRWMSPDASRRMDRWLLLVTAVVTSAWCLATARQLGATFDEPFYIESGVHFWREGDPGPLLSAGTMPLAVQVQTLPLYVIERARGTPWIWAEDVAAMLAVTRSGTLLFWWALLAYTLRLGRAVGGTWAGRFAMLLVAVEPNFLAHAGLATTDLALTACLMAFAYHFRDGRGQTWGRRVGLPLLMFALTVLAKASAITFGPLVMMAAEAEHLARKGTWRDVRPLALARDGAVIFAGGLLLAVVCCGTGGGPSFQGLLARMPAEHWLRPALAWVGALPLFPNGLYALWFQIDHAFVGQPTYLAGIEASRSLWFYLPLLLLIKLPLPILFVIGAAALMPRPRTAGALGLVLTVLALMVMVRVQTGIRFVLPLLALLLVVAAARLAALPEGTGTRGRSAAVALLAAWIVLGTARAWPDPLRYTNEVAGDTRDGYRFVSDSNYDWGQGLPELAAWQEAHGVPLSVWYFGTDPRYQALQRHDPRRDGLDAPALQGRHLAVSASLLYGGYLTTPGPGRDLMHRLRERSPIARTRTFFIFDEASRQP